MKTLQKIEDTWCKVLGYFRYRIKFNPKFAYVLRVVVRMAPYTNRNRNGNLYVRYLYWNDDRWNWSNNWLENDWNSDNSAAVLATLFISQLCYARGCVLLS